MESKGSWENCLDYPDKIVNDMLDKEMRRSGVPKLVYDPCTAHLRLQLHDHCHRRILDFIAEVEPKLKEICSNEAHRTVLPGYVPKAVKLCWYANIGEEDTAFLDHYMKFRCGPKMTEKVATTEQQRLFAEVLRTARAKFNKDIKDLRERYLSDKQQLEEASKEKLEEGSKSTCGPDATTEEVVTSEQQKLSAEACGKIKEEMNTPKAEQPVSDQSVNKRPLDEDIAEQLQSDRSLKKPCLDEKQKLEEASKSTCGPDVTEEVVTSEQQKLSAEACGKIKEEMNTPQAEQPVSDQSVNKRSLDEDIAEHHSPQPVSDQSVNKRSLDEDIAEHHSPTGV